MTVVTHMTSVHSRFDVRVYYKQVQSLLKAGYKVNFIVADGAGSLSQGALSIIDCGSPNGRLCRIFYTQFLILRAAFKTGAELFHFHDPELLFSGLILRLFGKKVVFDSHENVQLQILQKRYLNKCFAHGLSLAYRVFEFVTVRFLSGVVSVTPSVDKNFYNVKIPREIIANYPILDEFTGIIQPRHNDFNVCYVGAITRARGALEMVAAIQLTKLKVTLHLMGDIEDESLLQELIRNDVKNRMVIHQHSERLKVSALLSQCVVGLCILHPLNNHLFSLPNKLFEYMAAGLPVIVSDFPYWRKIVADSGSGLVVQYDDVSAIAKGIDQIIKNKTEAKNYGLNGLRYIRNGHNWGTEEQKLLKFYNSLLRQEKLTNVE